MDSVIRHSLSVRLTHWSVAASGAILLFSGFGQLPMYKRYNLVKVYGFSWSSDYEITLLLHYISAAIFTAAILFHLVYHLRRREFGALPQKGDLSKAVSGLLAMLGLGSEPKNEKFQAKQRVIYLIMGSCILLLVATGLIKSFKNLGAIVLDPIFLQGVAFVHTIGAMVFLLLFLAHLGAFLFPQHWPLVSSMFHGKISMRYVRKHHSEWIIES